MQVDFFIVPIFKLATALSDKTLQNLHGPDR